MAIVIASAAIRLLPFERAARVARIGNIQSQLHLPEAVARRVRWALLAWARRLPWRALCFEQGLAAQILLRRRGYPARLFYGASNSIEEQLKAHVWVRVAETDVIGCEMAPAFALLAVFPEEER